MELVRNGLASAILTLCVFGLCAVLWMVVSRDWTIFGIGWAMGVGTVVLAIKVSRWWRKV